VHTFSGAGKTMSGSAGIAIPSLTVTGTLTNSGTLTVGTALAGAGTLNNSSTGTINIGGTCSITTLANAGTINRTGTGTTTTTLANFTNTGTINLNGSGTITGITNNTGGIVNQNASATITSFNNGTATSTLNISTVTVPVITTLTATASGNTVNYTGASDQTDIIAQTYYNLGFSGAGAKTTASGTLTVGGNWDISGGTAKLSTNNSSVTVTGNITGTGAVISGSGTIILSGSWTNSGTFTKGSGTVIYNGGAAQTLGALSYNNLTINNSSGVSLTAGDATVTGTLTLTSGVITTGSNRMILGSAGSAGIVSRTSGHVNGNLRMYVPNSDAPTIVLDIGDATNYTPVSIIFSGTLSGSGSLDGSTAVGQPPAASGISQTKYINRKWTVTNTGVGGFTSFSPTFTFVDGDKVGAPDTNVLVIRKLDSGTWTATTIGTRTSNTTQCTGLTSFSEFDIGEQVLHHFGFILATPQTSATAFIGTNTLTAQDILNQTITTFEASDNNITIAAVAPLTGNVSGLSGGNKLTSADDFTSGIANLTTLGIKYTGNATTGTFTATAATGGYTGTSGSVVINPAPATTWTGTTSSDWNTATNWTGGSVPTNTTDVNIPNVANDPAIGATVTVNCKNLTIENGATLTIESDASNSGSLIMASIFEGPGTITYNRYMTSGAWHLVSAPVSGQTVSSFLLDGSNGIAQSAPKYAFSDYNEGTNLWNDYFESSNGTSFVLTKGYEILRSSSGVVSFTGTPATSTSQSITRTGKGWNCIGNPFTSAMGVNELAATTENFLTYNSAQLDPSFTAVYYWDGSAYQAINQSSSDNKYLTVGQGFFVRSKIGGATVQFTSAMQSHQTTTGFKSTDVIWPLIRLIATSNSFKGHTDVAFNPNMTRGLDPSYDAGLFRCGANLVIYTRLVEDNGIDFSIQCLPDYEFNQLVVPIGFDYKDDGQVVFTAETVDLPVTCHPMLLDQETGIYTDLTVQGASYTTSVATNTNGIGRFYLCTGQPGSGIQDEETRKLRIFAFGSEIHIEGPVDGRASAKLYDMTGRVVASFKLQPSTLNILHTNISTGTYIFVIQDEYARIVNKLEISK
jgi:hypothetical protein